MFSIPTIPATNLNWPAKKLLMIKRKLICCFCVLKYNNNNSILQYICTFVQNLYILLLSAELMITGCFRKVSFLYV